MLLLCTPSSSALAGKLIEVSTTLDSLADKISSNTGTTNSFTGVDAEDLSGGVFNNASLLQGNNLACYVYQLSAQAKPDILLGALNQLTSAIEGVIGRLGCPKLQATDAKLLNQFPGYTRNPVYG